MCKEYFDPHWHEISGWQLDIPYNFRDTSAWGQTLRCVDPFAWTCSKIARDTKRHLRHLAGKFRCNVKSRKQQWCRKRVPVPCSHTSSGKSKLFVVRSTDCVIDCTSKKQTFHPRNKHNSTKKRLLLALELNPEKAYLPMIFWDRTGVEKDRERRQTLQRVRKFSFQNHGETTLQCRTLFYSNYSQHSYYHARQYGACLA